MDREEFKKFLKMIQAMGITDYKINDHHVRLINQSYVYMIVDKEPDYADDESLRVIKGLMRDSHLLKEPNFKESEFNELLLTFNHISKYKRRVERQVRFVIGNVDNSVVIGHTWI